MTRAARGLGDMDNEQGRITDAGIIRDLSKADIGDLVSGLGHQGKKWPAALGESDRKD